jgi:2-polyprenyl-6-methoxyphenol hydroxylase-like FAD-dependent oxidoreductase
MRSQEIEVRTLTLTHINDSAIVIGGSIAGLLSARVLADRFTSVTIVETDKLPELPNPRIGVPQSVQPHILFTKGYRILGELFPKIEEALKAQGALSVDWTREFHHFSHQGWNASSHAPSDLISVSCSRPLLEWTIRQQLAHYANVHFVDGYRVTGLLGDARIRGVSLRAANGTKTQELSASLVVDASGRRSQAPSWLQELGFAPPPETTINPFLGYATRRYREPEGFKSDWKVMLISHSPPNGKRLGYLAKIEDGEWIATLGGYGGDYPPTNDRGFLEFARSLPSLEFYEAIKEARPTSRIYAHRATTSRLRHYEKIKLPQGFVCLGDAVCALCPVYGQGMTVSAIAATILRDWLNQPQFLSDTSSARFQKKLAKSNSLSWILATEQDLRFSTTIGGNKPIKSGGFFPAYTERLLTLTNSDPKMNALLMEVAHLLKSPLALYHPQVMFQVLTKKFNG